MIKASFLGIGIVFFVFFALLCIRNRRENREQVALPHLRQEIYYKSSCPLRGMGEIPNKGLFLFNNMERKPKGIFIPIEIWENKELSWSEKILLLEIDSFTDRGEPCFFSNEYVAELLGVKENTASILMSKLIKKGYVRVVKFDGRRRYIESLLGFGVLCQSKADFDENQRQTLISIKHNNINIIDKDIYKEKENILLKEKEETLFTEKQDNSLNAENSPSDRKKESCAKERKESDAEIVERKRKEFADACAPFVEKYGRDMVNKFYAYWTEANGSKLKWEITKAKGGTFEISRRLVTWAQNNTKVQPTTTQPTKPKRGIWEDMGLTKEQYINLFGDKK